MEDIKSATLMTSALNSPNKSSELKSSRAIEGKSHSTSDAYDAKELRNKIHESRIEGSKNLETVRERLKEISDSLNTNIQIRSKNLKFSVDQITDRLLMTVSNRESGKVIKQIPSETVIKISHSLDSLKGVLYDDKY